MNAARVDIEQDGVRVSVEVEGDIDTEAMLRKLQAVVDALAWHEAEHEGPPPFDDETLPLIRPGDDPTM